MSMRCSVVSTRITSVSLTTLVRCLPDAYTKGLVLTTYLPLFLSLSLSFSPFLSSFSLSPMYLKRSCCILPIIQNLMSYQFFNNVSVKMASNSDFSVNQACFIQYSGTPTQVKDCSLYILGAKRLYELVCPSLIHVSHSGGKWGLCWPIN